MFPDCLNNRTLIQRAIYLLLCIVAWRGPVPMLHDHQAFSSSDIRERHERVFHPELSCAECAGLHWHFAFPEDVNGKTLPDSHEVAPELVVYACAIASQCVASDSLEAANTILSNTTLSNGGRDAFRGAFDHRLETGPPTPRPKSFLTTLLGNRPLIAVTGVCLL